MDRMTEFATNATVRKLVSKLQLPLTLPTAVRRGAEQDIARPLLGRTVALTVNTKPAPAIVRALAQLGASFVLVGDAAAVNGAADITRSAGRPTETSTAPLLGSALPKPVDALIADVGVLGGPKTLLAQLQPALAQLRSHCRVVLLNRVPRKTTPAQAADVEAVFGFAKSLARELGKKAITVNVVDAYEGASDDSLAFTLGFLVSDRARYVTSQRFELHERRAAAATLSLSGEHALVTGGARGIGAAIAQTLARQGARVTLVDLANARDGAAEVCARITRDGGKAHFVPADITKRDETEAMLRAATQAFGPVQVLVNNAGITRDKTFAKMSEDKWNQVIAVNYDAAVALSDAVLAGGPARVVFLSSVVGLAGNFGQTNYTLSKAAIVGYVHALAAERPELQVTAVAPGMIDTALTREIPFLNREVAKQMIALLQAGEPEDVAEVAAFLASPGAAGLSGSTVRVDGGMFVGR
jgi:3-oxoacyl-[acyl-carrier protein] reductase